MFDKQREDRIILTIVCVLLLIFFVFTFFAVQRLEKRKEQCTEMGGVLVKTASGPWQCLDSKVLK